MAAIPRTIQEVLKDVVVYVEVRYGADNRTAGVKNVISRMGAKVNDRLLKYVFPPNVKVPFTFFTNFTIIFFFPLYFVVGIIGLVQKYDARDIQRWSPLNLQ